MSEAFDSRRPDPAALAAALRRAGRAAEAPWLHAEVGRRMAERLVLLRQPPPRVVDWWSAEGGTQALLREQWPRAEIAPVEPDPALQSRSLAAQRRPWWRRVAQPPAPAVRLEADAPQDGAALLWANMVLHRVPDAARTIARWHAALAVDGFLMFSTLGPDTLRELRSLYTACGWGEPAQAFVDMHDVGDALVHAGFADPVMDMETLCLSWPDPAALLAELRTLGGNAAPRRLPGLRTPRWRTRLEAALRERLGNADGRLQLSFEIVYGHAIKPLPRVPVALETTVGVEQLRQLARRGRGGSGGPGPSPAG